MSAPSPAFQYMAAFEPQQWVGDDPIPVASPTVWDCTAFAHAGLLGYLTELDDGLSNRVVDIEQRFKDDPAAPEWVRAWDGPCSIVITRSPTAAAAPHKHDRECRRRREHAELRLICTCGLTDREVAKAFHWDALELLDGGIPAAGRARGTVRRDGRAGEFDLPVWKDSDGQIRIGLAKLNPQFNGDIDQVAFDPAELLAAVAQAMASPTPPKLSF